MGFKAGDEVIWESQAKGSWKEKTGRIIAVVPAGESAKRHVPKSAKKSHLRFDIDKAKIDRALVRVMEGKNGDIAHYYCPRSSILMVAPR